MKTIFILMSLVHLGVAFFVLFDYESSKFEMFCAYMICALTFFARSIEGDTQ